jgi:hypothetical protein
VNGEDEVPFDDGSHIEDRERGSLQMARRVRDMRLQREEKAFGAKMKHHLVMAAILKTESEAFFKVQDTSVICDFKAKMKHHLMMAAILKTGIEAVFKVQDVCVICDFNAKNKRHFEARQ